MKKLASFLLHSVRGRIISGVLLLHAVLMGLVVIDMVRRQQNFMEQQIASEGLNLASTLAINAPSWLLSNDVNALDELVSSLKSLKHLNLALILDRDGRVRATTEPELFNLALNDGASIALLDTLRGAPERTHHQLLHNGMIDSIVAITANGKRIGYARVILDTAPVQAELNAITEKGIAYTLIAILLGGLIAWLLVRTMTRRLNLLSKAADTIAAGNLAVSLPDHNGKDEVARLTRDFNQMVRALQRDIAERRRLEREIIDVSEEEQKRIGQELHDGLGQHLTGIAFLSKVLEQKLSGQTLPEAKEASEIVGLVNEAVSKTRILARGLHPVELDENGLMAALEQLAGSVRALFGIECTFRCSKPVRVTDQVTAINLYRIAQEAVNNAIKHSGAKCLLIALSSLNGKIALSVSDDGAGFDLTDPDMPKGMGLNIMRYRAAMIGASLDIRRNPGGGTTVSVCQQSAGRIFD